MKVAITKYNYHLALLVIFVLAEIVVQPFGDFPLNDDWAYAKPVIGMLNGQKFSIGECPAMTLVTHLVWGFVFVKAGGFSFELLRLSTMVASFIGIVVLFSMLRRITSSSLLSFVGALTYLFVPMYFNLTNTYMTDITFSTILILGVNSAMGYFQNGSKVHLIAVYVFSFMLVFTRQYGIILPFSFLLVSIIQKHERKLALWIGLVSCALILFSLKQYEAYLHTVLPDYASYKYSGEISPLQSKFWITLFKNIRDRHATVALQSIIYLSPFAMVFFFPLLRGLRFLKLVILCFVAGALVFVVFHKEPFPMGNVLSNVNLGTETFYESLSQETVNRLPHTRSETYERWCNRSMLLGMTAMLVLISVFLWRHRSIVKQGLFSNPLRLMLVLLFLFYTLLIFVTESYFDRYHLPLILIGILMVSFISKVCEPYLMPGVTVLILMSYVSMAGTKDYFTLQNKKWEACAFLQKQHGAGPDIVNAGYEYNGWNESKPSAWYLFLFLKQYHYLVQYSPEPGFRLYRSYEFQRYFPYKRDKINIFVNDSIKTYD